MHKFPGGLTARVTPVPIPNTEVKPCRADDTALETTRERRSPPGLKFKKAATPKAFAAFFIFAPIFQQIVSISGEMLGPLCGTRARLILAERL